MNLDLEKEDVRRKPTATEGDLREIACIRVERRIGGAL
jgi:hypothetical protein